ncbi:type IV fimbrial biogenesis protein FimT [Luteimonas cucumeris]|uniref:Type II secretion system protein H n=2 Tax=Luteimonas cucumeris TaxID=985012 RepID=A0A562KXQ3_9GAMM|nr:type IV fimbrial biogenesis protein FimT [Luteimonas cucumeris]
MKRRNRGFSLIEALTVLAVVAVLATIGLPALTGILQRTHTATASHLLTSTLSSARSTAVMRRQPVTVCPSRDQQSCRYDGVWEDGWILFVDAKRTGQPGSTADILRVVQPLGGNLILRASAGRERARFQPDGRSTGSTLTLSLCSAEGDNTLAQVVLNNWGRARTVRAPASSPVCTNAEPVPAGRT